MTHKRKPTEFPEKMYDELLHQGLDPRDTHVEPTFMEVRLEHGILTLWPDQTWDWHPHKKKGDK